MAGFTSENGITNLGGLPGGISVNALADLPAAAGSFSFGIVRTGAGQGVYSWSGSAWVIIGNVSTGTVTGGGTPGNIPVFVSGSSIGDSVLTQVAGALIASGNFTAAAIIKSGGTAAQILMADGSVIAISTLQPILSGTGIVKSTAGVISYLTDPLPVANGGTGLAALTANLLYKGNGAGNIVSSSLTDNGAIVSTTEAFTAAGLGTLLAASLTGLFTNSAGIICSLSIIPSLPNSGTYSAVRLRPALSSTTTAALTYRSIQAVVNINAANNQAISSIRGLDMSIAIDAGATGVVNLVYVINAGIPSIMGCTVTVYIGVNVGQPAAASLANIITGIGILIAAVQGNTNAIAFYISGDNLWNTADTGTWAIFVSPLTPSYFAGNVHFGSKVPTPGNEQVQITGNASISGLAGTGTRMVTADPTGVLGSAVISNSFIPLAAFFATVSNTITTQQSLYSFNIPANTLINNGDSLEFSFGGLYSVVGANVKQVGVQFGITGVYANAGVIAAGDNWSLMGMIIRDSSTTFRLNYSLNGTTISTGTSTDSQPVGGSGYAGIINIALIVTGLAVGDITARLGKINLVKAP